MWPHRSGWGRSGRPNWSRCHVRRKLPIQHWTDRPPRAEVVKLLWFERATGMFVHGTPLLCKRHLRRRWRVLLINPGGGAVGEPRSSIRFGTDCVRLFGTGVPGPATLGMLGAARFTPALLELAIDCRILTGGAAVGFAGRAARWVGLTAGCGTICARSSCCGVKWTAWWATKDAGRYRGGRDVSISMMHVANVGHIRDVGDVFDGIITLVLAIMIWRTWPASTAWAIGILLGISMLFSGISRLMLSLAARCLLSKVA